jgi:hypothetical protein
MGIGRRYVFAKNQNQFLRVFRLQRPAAGGMVVQYVMRKKK